MNRNSSGVPQKMEALELARYDPEFAGLQFVQKAVPHPEDGQVLIRIYATAINPSDLMFLRGDYGLRKRLPVVPGFEGSGVVIESGRGFAARALVGRRVACGAPDDGDGTWAQYMVAKWNRCVPLRGKTNMEQGAALLVNPLTAFAMIDIARRGRHAAIIQTAAASALGRMIVNLGRRFGIAVVNVVRRQEQVDLLNSQGAQYVLNSTEVDFESRLGEACKELRATLAVDAVGGEMTGQILRALPAGGRLLVLGALAREDCRVAPNEFIFKGKRVEGFWLADWFPRQSWFYQLSTAFQAQDLLATDLKTETRQRLPLEAGPDAIKQYAAGMTDGKCLLVLKEESDG